MIWYYNDLVCLEVINSALVFPEDISPTETVPCSSVCVCVCVCEACSTNFRNCPTLTVQDLVLFFHNDGKEFFILPRVRLSCNNNVRDHWNMDCSAHE